MSEINIIEYNLDFTIDDDSAIDIEYVDNTSPIDIEYAAGNLTVVTSGTNIEEDLIGEVDGLNLVFTTTYDMVAGSAKVFVNGLKQSSGTDFVESASNAITFSEAPNSIGFKDKLVINYMKEL